MQLEGISERKKSRNVRGAVRAATQAINVRTQRSQQGAIVVTGVALLDKIPTTLRERIESNRQLFRYFADQVRAKLHDIHNLCVVPVNELILKYKISDLLKMTKEECLAFVTITPGHPAIAFYITYILDGNVYAAYQHMNAQRQLVPRLKHFYDGIDTEGKAGRLDAKAKFSLMTNVKSIDDYTQARAKQLETNLAPALPETNETPMLSEKIC